MLSHHWFSLLFGTAPAAIEAIILSKDDAYICVDGQGLMRQTYGNKNISKFMFCIQNILVKSAKFPPPLNSKSSVR